MKIKELSIETLQNRPSIAFQLSGGKKIKGQVQERGAPFPCHVRLFEKSSGELISQVLTDDSGNYVFGNLNDEERFFVVAHHPRLQFNAVIQDNVVPK